MKVAPIIQYINRTSFTTLKNSNFSLVKDTVSFGTKKDARSFSEAKNKTHPETFERILEYTNEDNFDLAKIMLKDKNFPNFLIPNILKNTTGDNVDAKIEMYKFIKERKSKLEGDYINTLSSLAYTNNDNIELHKMMASRKRFPKSIIWTVLLTSNDENKEIGKMMIKDPDFPKERIANILSVVNSSNERIAELLIKKKDFPREKIGLVLSNINEVNSELCEYMLSGCDYTPSEIVEVLRMYPKES